MLKLYAFDRSPFGWKVRVALAEKNVPYEMIVPENKNGDPAFARLNPLPKDLFERARVRMIEDTYDQSVQPVIRDLINAQFDYQPPLLIRRKAEQVDHKLLEESRGKLHQQLQRLEAELRGKPWFGGDLFSLADAAHVPALTGTLRIIGVLPDPKYPALGEWIARAIARPAYKAAAPKEPMRIKEG